MEGGLGIFRLFVVILIFFTPSMFCIFPLFHSLLGNFPEKKKKNKNKKTSSFSCQLIPAYVGETRLLPLSPRSTTELLVKEACVSSYALQVIHQAPLDLLVL